MLLGISFGYIVKCDVENYSESWCLIRSVTQVFHYVIIRSLGIGCKSIVKAEVANDSENLCLIKLVTYLFSVWIFGINWNIL